MHRVAEAMARAERAEGATSRVFDPFDAKQLDWELTLDADVHVNHTHIPERYGDHSFKKSVTKPYRWVFPVHGTPEHVFENTIADAVANGYGNGMSYAHHQWGMQTADAVVTFWERHQALYQLATDKHTIIDLIPMGIDLPFWTAGKSKGKYMGKPSFYNCDNQHPFKWSIELIKLWPWVREELEEAVLHCTNIPMGIQRFVDTMATRYGGNHGAIIGNWSYQHEDLRNIFRSIDYYVSPVRYGDHNRVSMEAGAAGAKVISYPGNEYADFWMPEGDHRRVAEALIAIGRGDVEPRADKRPSPSEPEMAQAMLALYARICP